MLFETAHDTVVIVSSVPQGTVFPISVTGSTSDSDSLSLGSNPRWEARFFDLGQEVSMVAKLTLLTECVSMDT